MDSSSPLHRLVGSFWAGKYCCEEFIDFLCLSHGFSFLVCNRFLGDIKETKRAAFLIIGRKFAIRNDGSLHQSGEFVVLSY